MIKALKNKYALSNQGAKDLLKGIIYSVLANISLMFPVILLAIVLNQLLAPILGMNAPQHIWELMMKVQGGVSVLRKNYEPFH